MDQSSQVRDATSLAGNETRQASNAARNEATTDSTRYKTLDVSLYAQQSNAGRAMPAEQYQQERSNERYTGRRTGMYRSGEWVGPRPVLRERLCCNRGTGEWVKAG
jgi:hypothetical protein